MKIRETITALTTGDNPEAVRISRKTKEPFSDERLHLVLKYITRVTAILSGTVLVINIDTYKLLALLGAGIFFSFIYFVAKD